MGAGSAAMGSRSGLAVMRYIVSRPALSTLAQHAGTGLRLVGTAFGGYQVGTGVSQLADGDFRHGIHNIGSGGLFLTGSFWNGSATATRATIANAPPAKHGWRLGDPIDTLTAEGRVPSWTTIRQRYRKTEALKNPTDYTEAYLARMKRGLAPQRQNSETGAMESKELHHDPARRHGGLFDVCPLWPDEHAAVDAFRKLGR